MLNDEAKSHLNSYWISVINAYNDYENYKNQKEGKDPRFLQARLYDLRITLTQAKEIFTYLLDEGKGDPWFEETFGLINRNLEVFKTAEAKASEEITDTIVGRFRRMKGVELENIKVASERGINKAIIPSPRKSTKSSTTWTNNKTGRKCEYIPFWGTRNFMVMDVLAHVFLLKNGQGHFSKEYQSIFNGVADARQRESEIKQLKDAKKDACRYCLELDATVFRALTGKDYMTSKQIFQLLKNTSSAEFKISYPLRVIKTENGKKTIKEEWMTLEWESRVFELDLPKDGDPNYYSKWKVSFGTILGELFIHNLLTKGYDFVDRKIFSLPDSAQNFYRFFISYNKKLPTLELRLSTIVGTMNFADKDRSQLIHATIEGNCLEPLRQIELISSYRKVQTTDNEIKFIIEVGSKIPPPPKSHTA